MNLLHLSGPSAAFNSNKLVPSRHVFPSKGQSLGFPVVVALAVVVGALVVVGEGGGGKQASDRMMTRDRMSRE